MLSVHHMHSCAWTANHVSHLFFIQTVVKYDQHLTLKLNILYKYGYMKSDVFTVVLCVCVASTDWCISENPSAVLTTEHSKLACHLQALYNIPHLCGKYVKNRATIH